VHDGATAFDRALALSGRDPDWAKPDQRESYEAASTRTGEPVANATMSSAASP